MSASLRRIVVVGAAVAVVLGVAGCGGSGAGGSASGGATTGAPGGPTTTAPAKQNTSGPSGKIKLTGAYTYDGPFTGNFICHHDASGYLQMQGQEPYHLNIVIEKLRDGTFPIYDPDKLKNGSQKRKPDEPLVDIYGLSKSDAGSKALRPTGGSISIEGGGDRGHAKVSWQDDLGNRETVEAEVTWEGCVDS
jgi:hypothetical protein